MDSFRRKRPSQKIGFLLYEFVGTMFLTVILNVLAAVERYDELFERYKDKNQFLHQGASTINFAIALFAISFICWDVSPSQFNSGLAVGQYIFNIMSPCAGLLPLILSLISQFGGAFVGYLITTYVVFQSGNDDQTIRYIYQWQINGASSMYLEPRTMCPLFKSI